MISIICDRVTGQRPSARLIVANLLPIDDAINQFRSSPTDFSANARVQAFNATIPGIVAEHRAKDENVFFVDVNTQFTFADIADGLHPTLAGYGKLGDAWFAAIQAVPEPGSAVLLALAALAAACRGRLTNRGGRGVCRRAW